MPGTARAALSSLVALAVGVLAPIAAAPPAGGQSVVELSDVPVSSAGFDAAVAALAETDGAIDEGRAGIADLDRFLPEWTLARDQITAALPELRRQRDEASADFDGERRNLRRLAAFQYVQVGSSSLEAHLLTEDDPLAVTRTHVLLDVAGSVRLADVERYYGDLTEAEFHLQTAEDSKADLDHRIETAEAERQRLVESVDAATARVPDLERQIAAERRLAIVSGTDLPYVALLAYWNAARNQRAETPGCNLPWTVLAGIGRVESDHGRYGGSQLRGDGRTSQRIIGIVLDGGNETAAIPDTDGGALDGDARWDRAVGPMQFIPATWRTIGRDGDGDGAADPHDLFDAARSAAAYLCRMSGLDDVGRLREAILTYNLSNAYVDAVLSWAGRYAAVGV